MTASSSQAIRLRGVRQNNLKNLDLDLPLGKLIVVTGLSGAGKSSLVFDALHAEGNRRYAETFSPYARQFLELLDRPDVDSIENIRPSIAIEQGNTVRTSRSTVGTMTELTDYSKVWFAQVAQLHDPETDEVITADTPLSIWEKIRTRYPEVDILLTFAVQRPKSLQPVTILDSIRGQGYTRLYLDGRIVRIEEITAEELGEATRVEVIQDRLPMATTKRRRFLDSVKTALHYGEGTVLCRDRDGHFLDQFCEGLQRPGSEHRFRPASPALFSFNSPIGACPRCRGFGRIIEIDDDLVIPDHNLSLADGAIKAFSGAVYSECQRDLLRACKKHRVRTQVPFRELTEKERAFVFDGDPAYVDDRGDWQHRWYGVRRFFQSLEEATYKMHVRVFLSRYRAYTSCPDCGGTRLQAESLCWKWKDHRLPDLYTLPVAELLALLEKESPRLEDRQADLAYEAMVTRLRYLCEVGLGYLSLDRSSRSLSGGETQRVNLTSCLGTALVDTLFVLDEPSIGLHCRDIDRLIGILRRLTDQGNTVVVVEHDEAIMAAADQIIEIGPRPGKNGGKILFQGTVAGLKRKSSSPTGQYLSGRAGPPKRERRRTLDEQSTYLRLRGIHKHNLHDLDIEIPLQRFVALSGVSGSGKSTLLHNALYEGYLARSGKACKDPARIGEITCDHGFEEVLLIDQSPVSRTPRSNAALFTEAWDGIRQLYAQTDEARRAGFTVSHFSFNSGQGRCPHCQGLGYERVEMQFMADVFVTCPLCEGRQFREEILQVKWNGLAVDDLLRLTVEEACPLFDAHASIQRKLQPLLSIGLGYLPLGQPLNTLSGGESQRLKLVRFLGHLGKARQPSLLLLDEPTTGLHRSDITRLLGVLHELVDAGHSLVVIEHHPDVLQSADWLLELGPEAGEAGGRLVFAGTPEEMAARHTATAPFLAAEERGLYLPRKRATAKTGATRNGRLDVVGARDHNLKNLSVQLAHGEMTVLTGVSGSGKSTLAFDIIFAEGQRRFMESMSSWARQYVEQLPRPDIDRLSGIPPTIAIEQRVTHGTRKSTVATITEVAQYLRLLYARAGTQHSPVTGEALVALPSEALVGHLQQFFKRWRPKKGTAVFYVVAPLIRGRKGHHEPVAKWAAGHGFEALRIDGAYVPLERFERLDRYREHNVELVTASVELSPKKPTRLRSPLRKDAPSPAQVVHEALELGKGVFALWNGDGGQPVWFSTRRSDPVTGESFPDLDPKDFSWNAPRGWCPTCHGYGQLLPFMAEDEAYDFVPLRIEEPQPCPDCHGGRLNAVSRAVYLTTKKGDRYNLPSLLRLTADEVLAILGELDLDTRGEAILRELLPEIGERLRFLGNVGLNYLSLDRATQTLSGGEAQRIRLAAQLGSNLAGALYVLDEPSIGLHERDNERLLHSLADLKAKGNTLLVVEHDLRTMEQADTILDLGPGAGKHGGEILAAGNVEKLRHHNGSLTGRYLREGISHPLRGERRALPKPFNRRSPRALKAWLALTKASLRNLKGDSLLLPKGRLIGICGVSGAGKSTLCRDLLLPAVQLARREEADRLHGSLVSDGYADLLGGADFRSVIEVDQSPIGKTPRSTPATYIGVFDRIRALFAQTPEARMQGHTASTFSFNTKEGRCPECKGAGRVKLEMSFMPDTYVPCDACGGRRYDPEISEVRWNGASIADVLAMSFEEAATFFAFDTQLKAMLDLMVETGLGYLSLGQSSPTLSGGEAQRLKLVSELVRGLPSFKDRGRGTFQPNLYLLEEPTIGLHMADCERLIQLLHRLVDQGHTVLVIEHQLDILAEADYLVELGPEGGDEGGRILFQGTPEDLTSVPGSPTAPFLRPLLKAQEP